MLNEHADFTKPIAILGAGNGGCAMAGDLSLRGYKVNLFEHPDYSELFMNELADRKMHVNDYSREQVATLNVVTTDLEEAITDAKIINLVVPSTVQKIYFERMAEAVSNNQLLVIWAGRFGSLDLIKILADKQIPQKFTIAEVDTLPYGARKKDYKNVTILYTSRRLYVSTIPSGQRDKAFSLLSILYNDVKSLENVLVVAFSNPAIVVFGIGALLNAARIQHMQGKFYLFSEGITDAVANVMFEAYREMKAVANAFDFNIPEYSRKDFNGPTSLEGLCFKSPEGEKGFMKMYGPSTITGRYMMENIGDGLVPIMELGKLAGIDTSVINSVITIGAIMCNTDFRIHGRNLKKLGLEGKNIEQVLRVVRYGLHG